MQKPYTGIRAIATLVVVVVDEEKCEMSFDLPRDLVELVIREQFLLTFKETRELVSKMSYKIH